MHRRSLTQVKTSSKRPPPADEFVCDGNGRRTITVSGASMTVVIPIITASWPGDSMMPIAHVLSTDH